MITQVKFQCVTHHNTEWGNRQDWIGREINNPFTAPWRGPPLFVKRNLLFFEVRQTKKKKVFCLTPVEMSFQGRHSLIKALSLQHQASHTLPPHSLFTPSHRGVSFQYLLLTPRQLQHCKGRNESLKKKNAKEYTYKLCDAREASTLTTHLLAIKTMSLASVAPSGLHTPPHLLTTAIHTSRAASRNRHTTATETLWVLYKNPTSDHVLLVPYVVKWGGGLKEKPLVHSAS